MEYSKDQEYVLRTVKDNNIRFIHLWFTDVLGFHKTFVITVDELDTALERLYGAGKSALGQIIGENGERDELAFDADVQQLKDLASEAPVIRMASSMISRRRCLEPRGELISRLK